MKNKIHLMDCLDGLRLLDDNSVDLIITDPPYIVDTTTSSQKIGKIQSLKKLYGEELESISNGFDIDLHLNEWDRVCKKFNAFIFCSNKQISDLMKWGEQRGYVTTCLVWHKYNAPPLCNGNWISDIEFCIHIREKGATFQGNYKLKSKVHRQNHVRSQYDHPTVKPTELIEKYMCIGSNENDVVLDPFIGSGTTASVAINLNRQFIGFEIESKYYNIAKDRVEATKGNVGLFANL